MRRGIGARRVSRPVFMLARTRRGELVDPRRVDAQLGEDVAPGVGDLSALTEVPPGAGEGADHDAVELAAQLWPGGLASVLGDSGQQQGQPAQDDMGADAFFLAVTARPQADDLLEVALYASAPPG
jgi:hypothetical protein